MSPLLTTIALWLADFHLLATALIAVALVAMFAARQPARRMAVAKSTLAALAVLAALCALPGWSLVHLLADDAPTASAASTQIAGNLPKGAIYDPLANAVLFPVAPQPKSQPQLPPSPPPDVEGTATIGWPSVLMAIHAMGSAAIVIWLASGGLYARRLRTRAKPAPVELTQLLAPIASPASAPQLLVSPEIAAPVALGTRRPAIILPAALASQTSPLAGGPRPPGPGPRGGPASAATFKTLSPILAHEWAHIAAGDLRTLAASRVLLTLLWLQPLFWLLRRIIRLDQETLADAAAAEVAGRIRYAEQLLGLARTATAANPKMRVPRLAGAVGLWEGPSQLKRRIAALLDEKITILRAASRRWQAGSAFAALIAAGLLSLVTLQPQEIASAQSQSAPATTPTAPAVAPDGALQPPPVAVEAAPAAAQEVRAWARPEPNVMKGRTVDEAGKVLPGVEITLYLYSSSDTAMEQIAVQTSAADGTFRFENVVDVAKEFPRGLPDEMFQPPPIRLFAAIGRAPGRAPSFHNDAAASLVRRGVVDQVAMMPSATLRGRVTDAEGRPVAGAKVVAGLWATLLRTPLNSATTDADGRYAIDNLVAYDAEETKRQMADLLKQQGAGITMSTFAGRNPLIVEHPDFAKHRAEIQTIPGELNVQLKPGGVIEGVAMLHDENGNARPAANVVLGLTRELSERQAGQPIDPYEYQTAAATTDERGRYRFVSLPASRYLITADVPEWTTQGLEYIEAGAGQVTQAPELTFTRGGTVRVKLVDVATGAPLELPAGARGWINPQRRPAPPRGMFAMNPNMATFTDAATVIRLAPGDYNFLVWIPGPKSENPFWQSTNYESFQTDPVLTVVEGAAIEVTVPMKLQTMRQTATGIWIGTTPAADGNQPAKSDSASSTDNFVPAVVPAEGPTQPAPPNATPPPDAGAASPSTPTGLRASRASTGVLGTLTPKNESALAQPVWTLHPSALRATRSQ